MAGGLEGNKAFAAVLVAGMAFMVAGFFADVLVHPEELDTFLGGRPAVEMVFHLGAVSETAAVDGDHTWATNVELSRRLWEWCADRGVRMVYASSAATYGDGSRG